MNQPLPTLEAIEELERLAGHLSGEYVPTLVLETADLRTLLAAARAHLELTSVLAFLASHEVGLRDESKPGAPSYWAIEKSAKDATAESPQAALVALAKLLGWSPTADSETEHGG